MFYITYQSKELTVVISCSIKGIFYYTKYPFAAYISCDSFIVKSVDCIL